MSTRCSAMQALRDVFLWGLWSTATNFNAASSTEVLWRLIPNQVTIKDIKRYNGVWEKSYGCTTVSELIWNQKLLARFGFRHGLQCPLPPLSLISQTAADAAASFLLQLKVEAKRNWGCSGRMIAEHVWSWHMYGIAIWHVLKLGVGNVLQFCSLDVEKKGCHQTADFPKNGMLFNVL